MNAPKIFTYNKLPALGKLIQKSVFPKFWQLPAIIGQFFVSANMDARFRAWPRKRPSPFAVFANPINIGIVHFLIASFCDASAFAPARTALKAKIPNKIIKRAIIITISVCSHSHRISYLPASAIRHKTRRQISSILK